MVCRCIVSSGGLHVNKDCDDDDDEWRTVLEKGAGNAMTRRSYN